MSGSPRWRRPSRWRLLRRWRRDADYIWWYPFPEQIETHCRRHHPDLTDRDWKPIDQGLREWFLCCAWRDGEYLHHAPESSMTTPMAGALEATNRAWERTGMDGAVLWSLDALLGVQGTLDHAVNVGGRDGGHHPHGSGAAALLLAASATPAAAFKGFETPSHNIGYVLDQQGARCDIHRHSWPLPKRPKSCEFDHGGSLFIGVKGRGEYGCVSDSAMGAGPVLPYGETIRKGRFEATPKKSACAASTVATATGSSSLARA
jgi:hypothetical protein